MSLWKAIIEAVALLLCSALLYPLIVKVYRRHGESRLDGLYDSRKSAEKVTSKPKFEIIAVHSLGAHYEYTWTRSVPTNLNPTGRVNLLELLGETFTNARIRYFSYDSYPWANSPIVGARELGKKLYDEIVSSQQAYEHVPIIFISHSFGGLVVKEALRQSSEARASPHRIIDRTCGIIFLGTPHHGSNAAALGTFAASLLSPLGSTTLLLLSLRKDESHLSDLSDDFKKCLNQNSQRKKIRIVSFYETKPTYLFGWIYLGRIVDRNSANVHANEWHHIATDHSGLNKCRDENEGPYQALVKQIKCVSLPSDKADTLIRAKCYDDERLRVERISGKQLELENCYINLTILSQDGRGTTSDTPSPSTRSIDEASADDMIIINPPPHFRSTELDDEKASESISVTTSLSTRSLDLASKDEMAKIKPPSDFRFMELDDEPASESTSPSSINPCFFEPPSFPEEHSDFIVPEEEIAAQILPANIFEPCTGPDGFYERPRRVLIRGNAGSGKTTLCKKIVYDFKHEKLWKGLFDRLLWVPLRRLETYDRLSSLEDLFYEEYFSTNMGFEVDGKRLARALLEEVTREKKTLFLLDGLDKLLDTERDNRAHPLLMALLKQPNFIIMSRPYAKVPDDINVDLELQLVGFSRFQVRKYINMAFPAKVEADKVYDFLLDNGLIEGLARIPIILDAICHTWDATRLGSAPQTMTVAYNAIAEELWKKSGSQRSGIGVDDVKVGDSRTRDKTVKHKVSLLEALAFTGHYNGMIYFSSKHYSAVLDEFQLSHLPGRFNPITEFQTELRPLTFFRTSDLSPKHGTPKYYFIHLTFQEYFAARYFARHWEKKKRLKCLIFKDENISAREFIRKFKYDKRYNLFWRFVAGLLDGYENRKIDFLEEIESKPRDLLGVTHQRLVMCCLNEMIQRDNHKNYIAFSKSRETQLSKWLRFGVALEPKLWHPLLWGREWLDRIVEEAAGRSIKDEVSISLLKLFFGRIKGRTISPALVRVITTWINTTDAALRNRILPMLSCARELPAAIFSLFQNLLRRTPRHPSAYQVLEIIY
ncbi:uncharacterized protein F4822DRAFT_355931 [Hypoxylon trugodes]|uniref:uncharacterized protein n=1 Tax=Hypoxylon trugodes TaxID=326681 RepID=UPI00218DB37C|nr:uncharacterized protein F4822DRAFT_355931 [Hypoxylon trugodes]KAI1385835.1 hypothetical protein F4822DRAFT_355931 [Hypoxylon trugodes]